MQQVRHQVTQRIAAFEHDLRDNWTPGPSELKLLTDEMAAGSQQPLWIVLRRWTGARAAGKPERQPFTHGQEVTHFRNREPLYVVLPTGRGDAVVEVFPVHAGFSRIPHTGSPPNRPRSPFLAADVRCPSVQRMPPACGLSSGTSS